MRKQKEERKSAESRPEASKAEGTVKAARASGKVFVDGRCFGSGKQPSLTRGSWKRSWRSARASKRGERRA